MRIRLEHFAKMNPDTPEYSDKNQHYSLSGVDPLYYLAQSVTQEHSTAPLAASRTFASIATASDGTYVGAICPAAYSVSGTVYDTVVVTDIGHAYGISTAGVVTDLGSLAHASVATGSVNLFNQKIWYNNSLNTNLSSRPLDNGGGAWGTTLSFTGSLNFTRPLKNFLDFMAVPDAPGGNTTGKHQLRKVTAGNIFATGIDLGVGWDIIGLENYNNRYLAIAAGYMGNDATSVSSYSSDYYIFLWNGTSNTYNMPIHVPGVPLDMKLIGTALYVLVAERSGQVVLYVVSRNELKRLTPIAVDTIRTGPVNGVTQITGKMGFGLFDYQGMVGVNLLSKGQYLIAPTGKFILTPQNLDVVSRVGSGGALIATQGTSVLAYGTSYSPISYRSQWIPVDSLAHLMLHYATPPQGNGDTIQVTLDGFDEDGTASSSLPLTTITSANFYNSYKTPLDVQGFTGSKCRVTLTTTTAGTWQPIIRYIDLINEK